MFFCFTMFYCYILFSETLNKYYVGSSVNLVERLRKHQTNHKGFTGKVADWKLLYQEEVPSKILALKREKEIKNWKSRIMIEKLIENSTASSKHPDL